MVTAALLVVLFLLSVVVYDSNSTLKRLIGRKKSTSARYEENLGGSSEEVTMSTEDAPHDAEPQSSGEVFARVKGVIRRHNNSKDKHEDIVNQLDDTTEHKGGQQAGVLRRLSGVLARRRKQETDAGEAEENSDSLDMMSKAVDELEGRLAQYDGKEEVVTHPDDIKEIMQKRPRRITDRLKAIVLRNKKPDENSKHDQKNALFDLVNDLRDTVGDLASRLSQAEAALGQIDQLESGLAKAGEDIEIISEDMKDVIGSLRVSIDGLESRLDQVNAVQQEGGKGEVKAEETKDEQAREKVKQLEEAVTEMSTRVASLPQDVKNNVDSIRSANERLDVITANLQSTIGYGIQRTFKCDSCGTEGLVANQIICSQCGHESWWGWWPRKEEPEEKQAESF